MSIISPITTPDHRVPRSFACRTQTAGHDAFIAPPAQIDNGDEALYPDKSGTYTKGVLQTGVGLVDLAAYQTFTNALKKAVTQGISKKFCWVGRAPSMVRKAGWRLVSNASISASLV